jgi:hypothetical protein
VRALSNAVRRRELESAAPELESAVPAP